MSDQEKMSHNRSSSSDLYPENTNTSAPEPYLPDDEEMAHAERVTSRYSYNQIYGEDADESVVQLQRYETRATVASMAEQSSLYHDTSVIPMEGDDKMPSGIEFEKEDPELVTWEGEDDPMNPRNFSKRAKFAITILASLQTIIPTYDSSVLAPAITNILQTYNNSNLTVGSLMVSIMVLVWGFSSMVWAPLSEIIGRRYVLLISAFFNLCLTIGCALAPNTAAMLVFRCISGVFNSAPISMSAGSLADVFEDKDRQWPLAIWSLAPSCGPALAPIIGGFIAQYTTWRWVFWTVVIFQGVTLVMLVLFFKESYPEVILTRKRNRLIKETGNKSLHTIWDLTREPPLKRLKQCILRPILFLTLNPVVLLLSIYLAFTYGFMYLILTEFPSLWSNKYHFAPGIAGLMYLGYAIGMIVGVFFWTSLINWRCDRNTEKGSFKLEDRLFWLPFATVVLAGGMFWYGWSAQALLPWPMPCVGIGIFSFALFCVFQSVQSYVVSLNARLAGSAISSCVLFRSILGGTFPLFGRAMYNHLGYGWASTVVALLAIVLGVPWPIGIYVYGPRLRRWVDENIHID